MSDMSDMTGRYNFRYITLCPSPCMYVTSSRLAFIFVQLVAVTFMGEA